ncbi:transposon Ty3-G Gag-Pol polyprotein [Trichonephila clavipes]|uniref:Transposon Ty3-G Gag-Pol polyprotein n=1 Tax=Trichonephila clavipes TaxID=2585209 RepID=A0A8X6RZW8_TRICX|nr:transposon Ty3-G Gag-Pol polyprotein [Trichonephila clavipes]
MAEVTAVKIPPYNFCDPQLWFSTCERNLPSEYRKRLQTRARNLIILYQTCHRKPPQFFAQRSEGAYVGTFSSAATDLSANYLGIHHANNRRESRRSRRQNPRRNLVGITRSFKKEPRNAFHPAAIKKERIQRGVIATTFSQPHISSRLFIKDKSSNTAFFIDTGSDVSVLPASISEKRKGNSIQQLSATNTSPINVYGIYKRLLTLDLNPRRTSGPPVFAKARRLAPDRLKIAKSEFQPMLNLGHIRPSKSNYASPLLKKILMIGDQWVTIVH